jgi:hypothetical protein
VQSSVSFDLSGLFSGVSVSKSTGASRFVPAAHERYFLDHFVPLLSTSYA